VTWSRYNCTCTVANLVEAGAAEETDGVETAPDSRREFLNMSAASKKKRKEGKDDCAHER